MHDVFWYLLVPFGWELTILGVLLMLSALIHRWQRLRRERREIAQRLASALMQEPQRVKWTCRRCKMCHYGLLPMGPVCRECWQALDAYLQEVA